MAPSRPFPDRAAAGRAVARELGPLEGDVLVLGLARGGMPVAAEVARALGATLDVLVVRKVGHPAQPEYALGAVSEDGIALPEGVPEELVDRQLAQAREAAVSLRAGRPRRPIRGRPVVIVDDGLATGRSMATAVETVRRAGAGRLVVAVPVASGPGFRELAVRCDARAALVVEPPEFFAVGQFYDDFDQVDDATVSALLAAADGDGARDGDAPADGAPGDPA